jgi:hypothetical protein
VLTRLIENATWLAEGQTVHHASAEPTTTYHIQSPWSTAEMVALTLGLVPTMTQCVSIPPLA